MTIGQLKREIREAKLGITGSEGDARHWGKRQLPDDPMVEPEKGGRRFLRRSQVPDFDPGEKVKALYRHRRGHVDMAGDDISDDLPEEPEEPTGMRTNLPRAVGEGKINEGQTQPAVNAVTIWAHVVDAGLFKLPDAFANALRSARTPEMKKALQDALRKVQDGLSSLEGVTQDIGAIRGSFK